MREFKFRAWNGKRMLYNSDDNTVWVGGLRCSVNSNVGQVAIIDYENVMQFTGLHDKNGKEIYEGDIVICNNGHVGFVEFEKRDACFNVDGYYSPSDDYPTMAFVEGQPFEVVGNIHENMEKHV